MRRWGSVLVILVFCSLVTFAVEIEAWMVGYSGEQAGILQDLADLYFTPSTGIETQIVPISWGDYYPRYLLAAASRETPDIFTLGSETVDFGLRGAIIDLRKAFGQEYEDLVAQVAPATLAPFQFQGLGFGIPFRISTFITAFRTDILGDMGVGIPQTWAEAYPLQQKLRAQGKTLGLDAGGLSFGPLWGAYMFITQHGGNFFSENGFTSALDRPGSIQGFKEYIELYTVHDFPKSGPGHTPFINGEWVMNMDGSYLYSNLTFGAPQLAGKWELSVVPGTQRPDGYRSHSTSVGGSTLTIAQASKKPKEAWEFIKWFMSEPIQTLFTNEVMERIPGMLDIPGNVESIRRMAIPEEARKAFADQIEASIPIPYAVNVNVLYRHIDFAVHEAVLLGQDPEGAVRKAADLMKKDMESRRQEYERFLSRLR